MIKNSFHFTLNILLPSIFFIIIIGLLQTPSISPIYSATNITNAGPEKGSTLSNTNSNHPDEDAIGKTFIISNPPLSKNSIENLTDSQDSRAILTKENTDNNTKTSNNETMQQSTNFSSNFPQQNEKNTSSNLNHNNELQRGDNKVDHNGIHFYNINNCSMAKGSSGIGNLSECEDAEKEMREE